MHRINPALVVGVIQGMEPHCSFSEGIYVHRKWRSTQRVHVHQDRQLQLQYSCPVVELEASLRHLLVSIGKLQLLQTHATAQLPSSIYLRGLQLTSNVVFRCVCLVVCITLGPKAVVRRAKLPQLAAAYTSYGAADKILRRWLGALTSPKLWLNNYLECLDSKHSIHSLTAGFSIAS